MLSPISFRTAVFLVPAILMCIGPAGAETGPLPDGWRLPSEREMAAPFRADDPHGFLRAAGDFNGDGQVDAALVLVAEESGPSGRPTAIGAFAFLSQPGGGWRLQPVRILEHPLPVDFAQFGIVARKPGRYATACGAGYGDGCAPGEPASVDLAHAGLVCGLLESVAGLYWWNSETGRFDGVPLSD